MRSRHCGDLARQVDVPLAHPVVRRRDRHELDGDGVVPDVDRWSMVLHAGQLTNRRDEPGGPRRTPSETGRRRYR
jgi:hypothetical protein